MNTNKTEFERQTFTVSRELEYFSEAELTTQTGYEKEDWWPGVVVKELIDNALDACEQAGTPPRIDVEFDGSRLAISDNAPGGFPGEVLRRILDFSSRTSSKQAYMSPTRGAQGNALKVVLAIPYVLDGGKGSGGVVVESAGIRHTIKVSTNQVQQRPQIEHSEAAIVKTEGTTIRVMVNSACSQSKQTEPTFLQNLIQNYSLFNPHAQFDTRILGQSATFNPTNQQWQKWLSRDPTSAHWYGLEQLEGLIGSYLSIEQAGGNARTVREFVSEFRGLSATAKQKQVSDRAGLERAYLRDLAVNDRFDHERTGALLGAMKELSKPVRPE